jgi:hypothetical protein
MFDDDEETDFAIEGEFRTMRTLRKRRMPSELHRDDTIILVVWLLHTLHSKIFKGCQSLG